ncbi:MAG: hypothetical protein GDA48_12100 [Hormoscilla sp. GM102CHS1]|nr:hypothetical protein [Hormoscilla sp. GM102CHS1]
MKVGWRCDRAAPTGNRLDAIGYFGVEYIWIAEKLTAIDTVEYDRVARKLAE